MITHPDRKILAIPYFVLELDGFVFGELGLIFDIYGSIHSVSHATGHFTPSWFKSLGLKVYAKKCLTLKKVDLFQPKRGEKRH